MAATTNSWVPGHDWVAWPPADWAAAWERVRAEAADALARLRDDLWLLTQMAN